MNEMSRLTQEVSDFETVFQFLVLELSVDDEGESNTFLFSSFTHFTLKPNVVKLFLI